MWQNCLFLIKNRVKPGTMLIETVLSGDSLYQKWIGIWNFTYSWGSYIFRTTWVNHIEYSCSSFFFCNWKKGSGWKTKESHKNRSTQKSIYMSIHMSIHMIHFCTKYRKFWHVLSMKWIHFMFPFYAKNMIKISFMYIFLQLKIDKGPFLYYVRVFRGFFELT